MPQMEKKVRRRGFVSGIVVVIVLCAPTSSSYWKAAGFSLGVATQASQQQRRGGGPAAPTGEAGHHRWVARLASSSTTLQAKKGGGSSSSKRQGGAGGGGAGIKGFGGMRIATAAAPSASSASSNKKSPAQIDLSPRTRQFYGFLDRNGAGSNLRRTALANFPLDVAGEPVGDAANKTEQPPSIRGVVALKNIAKGEVIISIPYELANDLGKQGEDPALPAFTLLQEYCEKMLRQTPHKAALDDRAAYFAMLPPFEGPECSGCTDFFSDEALQALQAPWIVRETQQRRDLVRRHFAQVASTTATLPSWIDGSPLTEDHLRWAVWLVTSRVLTVQADGGDYHRVLIPYLDMCNHHRSSAHVLTGRAVRGGELKVVAGSPVKAGDQINICYGGGVAGNDRFLQDYGFLDSASPEGYGLIAQQLSGKAPRAGGGVASTGLRSEADRQEALLALGATTMERDEADLLRLRHCSPPTDPALLSALEFRIGVKKALRDSTAS